MLPAQLATDPEFEQRFRLEAYAAAGFNEPHVCPRGRIDIDVTAE